MADENPMARRLKTQKESDPLRVINEGLSALSEAPDDVKKEYAEPLLRAQLLAEKSRKNGTK